MMHNHGFHYSEEDRSKFQNPEQILKDTGLSSGMCFIDSGCNDGFFTLPASRIVGPTGKVYAIDIDNEALERLKAKLENESITNTEIIASPSEETVIDANIADVIFFGMVLHDFYDPLKVLLNSKKMLKESGIIYNYDWRKQDSPKGPPFAKRFSQEYVAQLASSAGLRVKASQILDDNFYCVCLTNQ